MQTTLVTIAIISLTIRTAAADEQTAHQQGKQGQVTAENCKPQPDCRINYPSLLPGASLLIQDGGTIGNIIRDPVGRLTSKRRC